LSITNPTVYNDGRLEHGKPKDTVKDTDKDTVNDAQNKILILLTQNPRMTIKEISAKMEINERNVKKILKY
jgi:predicted transcriptional regulator